MFGIKKGAATLLVGAAAVSGALLTAAPAGADAVSAYGPPNDARIERRNISEAECKGLAFTYNSSVAGTFRRYYCVTSNPPKMHLMSISRKY
ncbi:hypothetical protein O4J56_05745 [Nocardiopsis sp. RSe5-2]|uniref:Uncharacterized protein n=1 Tax=Nocardiopsis endophytica TaxID=3018445 RepID=A0ABT4TZL3_9ACTN|nr:hypothetical protein [Nocardiopsis endophytica]MDA2810135.1 hypothetical protein [Nocardiopsis endophytica]